MWIQVLAWDGVGTISVMEVAERCEYDRDSTRRHSQALGEFNAEIRMVFLGI